MNKQIIEVTMNDIDNFYDIVKVVDEYMLTRNYTDELLKRFQWGVLEENIYTRYKICFASIKAYKVVAEEDDFNILSVEMPYTIVFAYKEIFNFLTKIGYKTKRTIITE